MGLGLFWGGRGCGRDSGLPGGLWWGQEQRGAPGLRLWPRPSDGLSPQNAPDEQRPVPGLAVEARAVPGSPHCSPAGLLQQVGSGGAPTPRPALWLVRGSRSRPDLSVDLSPRACRAGQGKRSQACHFTGQVPTAPCSPGLALPPWLSPGFGPPPQISRLFPAELSPHFGQGGQLSGPSPPPPSGVGLRLRVHGGPPPPPPPSVCVSPWVLTAPGRLGLGRGTLCRPVHELPFVLGPGSTCCITPGARCSTGASLAASWPSLGSPSPRRSSPLCSPE